MRREQASASNPLGICLHKIASRFGMAPQVVSPLLFVVHRGAIPNGAGRRFFLLLRPREGIGLRSRGISLRCIRHRAWT